MDIALYDETGRVKQKHLSLVKKMVIAASKKLELGEDFEVSVTFVDNERIREINKEYRAIDRATDVISFAIEDENEDEMPVFFDEDSDFQVPRMLGDIFISIDRAEEQALDYNHSVERELGFLVVHGFLHLNGYDHQTKSEEKEMFALQEEILEGNNLER